MNQILEGRPMTVFGDGTQTRAMEDPARPPVIALRWDPDTGEWFRLRDAEDPFLRKSSP